MRTVPKCFEHSAYDKILEMQIEIALARNVSKLDRGQGNASVEDGMKARMLRQTQQSVYEYYLWFAVEEAASIFQLSQHGARNWAPNAASTPGSSYRDSIPGATPIYFTLLQYADT